MNTNENNVIKSIENFKSCDNRFIQRFHFPNFLDHISCDWIVHEVDIANLWKDDANFKNSTQDVSIFQIDKIKYYLVKVVEKIYEFFEKSYCIKNISVNFKDLFIVKYDSDHNHVSMHIDNCFMSFQILLNDDFTGGGTLFEDGISINPKNGELVLHCGKVQHSAIPITSGTRFVFVGFFDIITR